MDCEEKAQTQICLSRHAVHPSIRMTLMIRSAKPSTCTACTGLLISAVSCGAEGDTGMFSPALIANHLILLAVDLTTPDHILATVNVENIPISNPDQDSQVHTAYGMEGDNEYTELNRINVQTGLRGSGRPKSNNVESRL